MAIFEIVADGFNKVKETSFSAECIRERTDLQRLLRNNVAVISPDTLVIAEEFCDWEDCKLRIDLLGIDKDANLVVIELKRTEDGGHMELQAIRYAALVSAMTFERAVDVYAEYLRRIGSDVKPLPSILEFLERDEPNEDSFGQNVRILLVSADFSKTLTTAVMWLNDQGLDIRCVRIKPYAYDEKILAEVGQIIPLPEEEDYRVRFKEKQLRERAARESQAGGRIFGYAATTVINALARYPEFDKPAIQKVLTHFNVNVAEGTLNTQFSAGRHLNPKRPAAGLSPEQVEECRQIAGVEGVVTSAPQEPVTPAKPADTSSDSFKRAESEDQT